jgi:hypothetical protein
MTAEWAMVIVGAIGLLAAGAAFLWRSGEWSAGMRNLQEAMRDLSGSVKELAHDTAENTSQIARLTGRIDERNSGTALDRRP